MVSPFDLRGPQFLVFYLALGALVALTARILLRSREAGAASPRPLHDYLDIAFLRGGPAEAIRVAVLTLVERGLLKIVGIKQVEAVAERAASVASKATERHILAKCATATVMDAILSDSSIAEAARNECEPGLVRQGLLPSDEQRAFRRAVFVAAAVLLLGVAGVKIAVAMARGRTNIEFLTMLSIVSVIVAWAVTHSRQTSAGQSVLADMRTLFSGLRRTAASLQMGSANDFALLAATFGIHEALSHHPEARTLFPRRTSSSSSADSSSSCGSSCGSSSSSCGSSCGGGGGGCGGCGS
jgi:uncharacterized protein (TIGR04222 family)